MSKPEMDELGSIIALVLKNTIQAPTPKDPAVKSKNKYIIDAKAKLQALERIKIIQDRFPVYPGLDLKFLKEAFVN
jgi:hypothetical protein